MKCKLDYCDRTDINAKGLCRPHYLQYWRNPNTTFRPLKDITTKPALYRDENGFKKCNTCLVFKEESEFNGNKNLVDGLDHKCRACKRVYHQTLRWTKHGIDKEFFDKMLEDQNYRCAICEEQFEDGSQNVDHDHTHCSGSYGCIKCVRAILCNSCNWGIGQFRDNIANIRKAADYLESHKRL